MSMWYGDAGKQQLIYLMKTSLSALSAIILCFVSVSCTTTKSSGLANITRKEVEEKKSDYMPPPIFGYKDVLVWNSTSEPLKVKMSNRDASEVKPGAMMLMPFRLEQESMTVEVQASTSNMYSEKVLARLEHDYIPPLVQYKKNAQNNLVVHANTQVQRIPQIPGY